MSKKPWSDRLDYLGSLEAGWLNGDGLPVSDKSLRLADELLTMYYATNESVDVPMPGLFPTEEGLVGAEWYSRTGILTIEMGADYAFDLFYCPHPIDIPSERELQTDDVDAVIAVIVELMDIIFKA